MKTWALIPGFDGHYRISKDGRVESCHVWGLGSKMGERGKWRSLSTPPDRNGYPLVYLWNRSNKENGRVRRLVHQLVAAAFVENPDGKPHVNHIDGDKTNPHYTNLEWCTQAENMRHARVTGLIKGQKLTEAQVIEIRSCGGLDTPTAKRFGVSQVLITKIRARKVWKHIP